MDAARQSAIALVFAIAGVGVRVGLNASLLSPGQNRCYDYASGGLVTTLAIIALAPAVTARVAEPHRRPVSIGLAVLAAVAGTFIWSYRTTVFCAPL
ncbi:MAG TPA: hypothetical protein VGD01_11560 [Candidatus Elarobacter sp.]|jgi:hypothetical protein